MHFKPILQLFGIFVATIKSSLKNSNFLLSPTYLTHSSRQNYGKYQWRTAFVIWKKDAIFCLLLIPFLSEQKSIISPTVRRTERTDVIKGYLPFKSVHLLKTNNFSGSDWKWIINLPVLSLLFILRMPKFGKIWN